MTNKYNFLDDPASVIAVDANHAESVLNFLFKCYQEQMYCDVSIKVEQQVFKTHRLILAMISDYFRVLLLREGKDQVIITLPENFDSDVFETILLFGYTSKLTLVKTDLQTVAVCADFLGIQGLTDICQNELIKEVTREDYSITMQFAFTYNMRNLYDKCASILCRNFEQLSKEKEFLCITPSLLLSFLKLDNIKIFGEGENTLPLKTDERERLLFKRALKYIHSNCSSDIPDDYLEVLKAIKLPQLKHDYVVKKVKKYKKLKNNCQILSLLELAKKFGISEVDRDSVPSYWLTPRILLSHQFTFSHPYGNPPSQHVREVTSFNGTDTSASALICGIKLWIRLWDDQQILGGICITYDDGTVVNAGELNDRLECCKINLSDGEHINSVEIYSGWMIDSLKFITNKKTYGPFGGDGGGRRFASSPHETAYLHSCSGSVVYAQGSLAVIGLKFRWVHFE